MRAALEGFQVGTKRSIPGLQRGPVCHIAGSGHLRCEARVGLPRDPGDGRALSDHDGIQVDLTYIRLMHAGRRPIAAHDAEIMRGRCGENRA